jgi:hypothetical protein
LEAYNRRINDLAAEKKHQEERERSQQVVLARLLADKANRGHSEEVAKGEVEKLEKEKKEKERREKELGAEIRRYMFRV